LTKPSTSVPISIVSDICKKNHFKKIDSLTFRANVITIYVMISDTWTFCFPPLLYKKLILCSIQVIAFSDEEGVRFQSTFLGSAAVAGTLPSSILQVSDKRWPFYLFSSSKYVLQ
jgi:hypothetical protein